MLPEHDRSSLDSHAAHAAREAAHWLAVLSDEQCSADDRAAFFEWLRSSTRHVDEFLRISTIARRASQRSLWPDDDAEALVAAALAERNVAPFEPMDALRPPPARAPRVRWAIAASVAAVVACIGLIAVQLQSRLFDRSYATAVGEQRSITLEDGSVVQLNSRSRLKADFSSTVRAVELELGEAIFRVAKDERRPFRVRTAMTDIIAVGTAFNVSSSAAQTVVTVLEGRVQVRKRDHEPAAGDVANPIELAIGEQLIVSPEAPPVRITLSDFEKVTAWTERRLIFEETPLSEVAREFARYSTRTIRIDDSEIADRKISGVFDASDPASLVQALATTDETVVVRPAGDGWILTLKR